MLTESLVPVIASRWLHFAAVIVAVGGTVFLRLVLHTLIPKILPEREQDALRAAVLARWRVWLHACIGIILLSGTYNAYVMLARHKGQPLYHSLLGTKILLALSLFFIAIAITGRNPAFEGMRRKRATWMGVNIVLAAVIVAISNVLKNL